MTIRERFAAIEAELNDRFIEREDEIHGLVLGLLSRHHVLLLGKPGTAKSKLVRDMADYMGMTTFDLLMANATPDEVFGQPSIKGLKEDVLRRITAGRLPEAHIAFLDEIWKAYPDTLHSLLTTLGPERGYHNEGRLERAPLEMAVGASNEMPAEGVGLEALYDRFLLRYVVGGISSPQALTRLLNLSGNGRHAEGVTLDELHHAQAEAAALPISEDAHEAMRRAFTLFNDEGIEVSVRRWRLSMDVFRAEAWTQGHDAVTPDDILIGRHVFWHTPDTDHRMRVAMLLEQAANMDEERAQRYFVSIDEAWGQLPVVVGASQESEHDKAIDVLSEFINKSQQVIRDMEGLRQSGTVPTLVRQARQLVTDAQARLQGYYNEKARREAVLGQQAERSKRVKRLQQSAASVAQQQEIARRRAMERAARIRNGG